MKVYLGTKPPSVEELERYRQDYAYDLEIRAARKKAELSSSFYASHYLAPEKVRTVEELRYVYQAMSDLLTADEIEVYEKNFEVHYVQGTTAIEGNTLTFSETCELLMHGVSPREKSLREINEVQNFKNVIRYRNRYKDKVSVEFARKLHALILNNIEPDSAGTFRRIDDICISGCDLMLTPSLEIESELKELIDNYYRGLKDGRNPFEEAVLFHYGFETIHPFTDGNGRVGREILNYMLFRERYPKMLFLGKNRELYIEALRLGNEGQISQMVSVFADLIIEQRQSVLRENLKRVAAPLKRDGQMRMGDFILL